MKKFITLLVFTVTILNVQSQVIHTWQGPSTGGSWTNAANWVNGVPTAGTDEIVFDGSAASLSGGVITIADVQQTNSFFSYDRFSVINNATVTLSSASNSYLYFNKSILIEAGSRLNIGASSTRLFEFGGTFSGTITLDGVLDLQGTGNSSNSTNFVVSNSTFGSTLVATIKGTVILSGLNAKMTPNSATPSFENGSQLFVTRDGGFISKANYRNGSTIKIQGVVNAVPSISNSSTFEGVIEWNCPNQLVAGSSALVLPSNSFSYYDSLVINNTGTNRSIRLATNPSNNYVKNIIINNGTLEFSSPSGSGVYNHKVDTLIQNGGTLIGNAPGVSGFDNAFEPDTLTITGKFVQNGGTFDFSTRTPNNAIPNASFVLQVGGDVVIGGTVKLSKPITSPNCALVFNGNSAQNFSVVGAGVFSNKIKSVINNASLLTGVNLASNVVLPDSLVFKKGYLFLNNFDVTNPLPVQFGTTDFTKHVVTNGTGFFIQKKVKTALVGLPIAATVNTFNPLSLNVIIDSMDIAARVDIGLNPSIVFPNKAVNRTWRIKPESPVISAIGISFGYSDLGVVLGDGNPGFSYTDNNEVGLYDGSNWQVISGPIAPIGPNPYAVSHLLLSTLLTQNVATPLAVGNVSSITPIGKFLQFGVQKNYNTATVKWQVSVIDDVDYFDILHSVDGRNFTAVKTVEANLNSLQYSASNIKVENGTNYYRIKMVGKDGSVKLSTIANIVHNSKSITIAPIMPTITNGPANIVINTAYTTTMLFVVVDAQGKIVDNFTSKILIGTNTIKKNYSNLSNGMYFIKALVDGSIIDTLKFLKQ